jgi:hypothetical protein
MEKEKKIYKKVPKMFLFFLGCCRAKQNGPKQPKRNAKVISITFSKNQAK